jgi:hypothetical protein
LHERAQERFGIVGAHQRFADERGVRAVFA